jgi:type VI secretion system secreted protein VgrG
MAFSVELSSAAFSEGLVLRMRGREALHELWSLQLECQFPQPIEPESCLRESAVALLSDDWDGFQRELSGVIGQMQWVGSDGHHHRYTITVIPREANLLHCCGYQVFRNRTVPEIVGDVLEAQGLARSQYVFRLSGTYAPRPYLVMHGESPWRFVERLLAEEGIGYWFDAADSGPICVLTDNIEQLDPIGGSSLVPFRAHAATVRDRAFYRLGKTRQTGFSGVHLLAYDSRHPDVPIEGRTGDAVAEYYEYPVRSLSPRAQALAAIRLQQLECRQVIMEGESNCPRLQPGRTLEVETLDELLAGNYLVESVAHRYHRRGGGAQAAGEYSNSITLLPEGKVPRPGLPHRRRVAGLELAITTGPSGEEIHVDDMGSVTVRFPWDRSGVTDDQSSDFCRTVQMALGGSMILPRVGWEVPVLYHDGDPDVPIVLGRMYNAETALPYSQPGTKATTTFQSASSPGGGGTNELRMADDGGSQEMYLHASKDQTVTVGGSSTVDVGIDEVHDVGLGCELFVTGSQTVTIGAKQSTTVGGDRQTTISGARTVAVGGADIYKVQGDRSVACSALYTEVIGGMYGIQCNQSLTDVQGAYLQLVGAVASHSSAIGVSESVGGLRSLSVGGLEAMHLRAGYSESTPLATKIAAVGPVSRNAGAAVSLSHGTSAKVTVGGEASFVASGKLSVTAPKITIKASGALTAGTLKLSGGTFDISGGTSGITGTIKRKGGSKIE